MPHSQPMLTNLAPRYYADPAIFEAERQSIFRRQWQMLGPVSRLARPGDYLAVDVAGWKLFALRGEDGMLRAFHNVCRHRARGCWRKARACARPCAAPITTGSTPATAA